MRTRVSFLVACLLLVFAASSFGTTYYVSTGGNDNNNGSSGSPWATLQKAANTMAAGDTTIVLNGTYTGFRVTDPSSGTSGSPITIKAQNRGQVTLNAKPSGAKHNGIVELEGHWNDANTTVQYWVIDGFVINGNSKALMTLDGRWIQHCTYQYVTATGSQSRGLYVSHGDYDTVKNCTSYSNGEHGSYQANAGTYNTYLANTCYSNTSCGFHNNGDLSGGGTGLVQYADYEKNIGYSNGQKGFNCDGVMSSTFKNNLVYSNSASAFALFSTDAAQGSSNNNLFNNTLCVTGQWCIEIPSSSDSGGSGASPTGNVLENNILYDSSGHGSIMTYSSSVSGFVSDYNVVQNSFSVDDDGSSIALSTWRGYGYDTHSVLISDPTTVFNNYSGNDYHLKSGSPAVNAGTTISSVTDDMDGNSRPQGGAYDIGCYELVGGSALTITTSSLPADTVNIAYSQTLTATGGTTPYTWSLQSGSLPAGLSLVASTGAITGTPTASGTSSFTAKVTDNVAATATKALSIVVNAAVSITTASLPADTVNVAYNQTLAATGGTGALTWSLQSGSLPAGLSLVAGSGAITGTPTASGTSSFTAKATDTVGASGTKALSIVINAAVTITTASLPADTVNVAYNQTMTATGGTGALTWSLSSGSLPAGLSLTAGTGAITGTPTASGTSSFTARATDTLGASGTKALSIVINAAPSITTSSLPADTVGIAYNQTLAATGGTSPLTWSLQTGSLPAGLSLVAGTGAITGTPTASGTSSFTAKVADNVGASASKALSVVVNAAPAITTSSLPAGSVGVAYSQTMTSTGGTTPITWSLASGSLPAGLSLTASTGAITGTPTASGTSNFTAKVQDNVGASATKALSIVVVANLTITTTSLPATTVGVLYNQALAAMGGTTPYTWSIAAGSLPAGLSLTAGTGAITGTPTASGTSSFTAKVTDNVAATATKALSIVVNAAVTITTASLPADTVNVAYNQTLAATGGTGSLTWSLQSGSLPAGLSLVAGTGAITGTPTASGTSSFTAKATDTVGASGTKALSIVINAAVTITTASLPADTVNVAYPSTTLGATGGTGALTWSIQSGTLPAGLSLVAGTGAITGTPTASGTSSFTAKATDTVGASGTKALSIVINAAPSITTTSLPAGTINTAYSQTLAATGGTTPLTWSIQSGTLPAGLSLVASTGAITGTPTASGTSNFTAKVQDNVGASATKALSIVINAGGGTSATYQYVASDTEATTTSTTYTNKATMTFTPNASDSWLVFGFAEIKNSSTSYLTGAQLTIDGTVAQDTSVAPKATTDYQTFAGIKVVTLSAASHTFNIDYKTSNASGTAYIRNARIVAIRKSALELYSNDSGDTPQTLTSTLTNYANVSWTCPTATNYLGIWSAEFTANTTSYYTNIQGEIAGGTVDQTSVCSTNTGNTYTFLAAKTFSATANTQYSVSTAAAMQSGSTGTHQILRARCAAFNLDTGRFSGYVSNRNDNQQTTTSTSWQSALSTSVTPSTANNYFIFCTWRLMNTSTSYSVQTEQVMDGSTTQAAPQRQPNNTNDYYEGGCVDVRNLTAATHTFPVSYCTSNASGTAEIRAIHFIAFPL